MKSSTQELRKKVVEEAESWIKTPFHHQARLKGVGIDCLMFLAEVYERVGVVPHVDPPHYPPDWHMHQDVERYLEGVLGYAHEAETPEIGDVALFHFGRTFSHGAIIVEWPRVIHAYWSVGVVWGDARLVPLLNRDGTPREVKFFSPFTDE